MQQRKRREQLRSILIRFTSPGDWKFNKEYTWETGETWEKKRFFEEPYIEMQFLESQFFLVMS